MCGIAGAVRLDGKPINGLDRRLSAMSQLVEHRGPDGHGSWTSDAESVGFVHRRLAIIDLTPDGAQPMMAPNGTVITYNGEIYNYVELRDSLSGGWRFQSHSDTETILASYDKYGADCVDHLRGMFSYAIWDSRRNALECARDRFGIKPFYYTIADGVFYFASEVKALVPILPEVEIDQKALTEYLTFQYPITELTLFKGVHQLHPGHALTVKNGQVLIRKYWDVRYEHDHSITADAARKRIHELLSDSIDVHLRADVPIGAYLSGGVDSSLIALLAAEHCPENNLAFHGKFTAYPGYDESHHAEVVAQRAGMSLHQIDIDARDFEDNLSKVIYHLDYPVAGPGSFPQYMVSKLASEHLKVVLGGQGGDEIFGGYARYMVGYLERLIMGALDGNLDDGSYSVTFESVIPNLGLLREYKPLMQQLFSKGMFETLDRRFFRLIDRSTDMVDEIDWTQLDGAHAIESYMRVFNDRSVIEENAHLDSMSRFDFKRLLPALLQVEDRMSMAHGLESRVPLLDHPLVEYAATIPPEVKYEGGRLKELLRTTYSDTLPPSIFERRDKMGFPVPLKEWYACELNTFVKDIFHSQSAQGRYFMNSDAVLANFDKDSRFSRKTWGLLSLELWHQQFVDKAHEFRALIA
jgi:asparagine synthase (glutamine-hydrolysing)